MRRPSIATALREAGFTVRAAPDVETAIGALAEVDCVVTDNEPPDVDGFELLERARDLRPDLPVVFHPTTGSERLASEALAAGVDDYVASDDGEALPDRIEAAVADVRDDRRGETSYRRLRELHDATRELMSATAAEEVAERAACAAEDVLGYPLCTVRLHDRAAGALRPVAVSERAREVMDEQPVYSVDGDNPGARALRRGEPVYYDDIRNAAGAPDLGGVRAVMYIPLGDHGVLTIGATEPAAFDDGDRQLAEVLAANVTAALDRVEQRRELEAEHDRVTALFENIPDPAVYVEYVEGDPIVRDVNEAFERTFGFDADIVVGRSIDEFVVPPEREQEADRYNAEIQLGESLHGEVRRRTADGYRDFLLHVVPHQTDEQNTRGFAIYTDITERKERERELERQNERLEEFASVVSHDLRNPLNVAQGRLDLARETGDEEHLEAVERAHSRMERLIEDLLALARQGREVGETEPVDLEAVAEAAWNSIESDDATLEFADPPTAMADEDRLQQLLENLFRNSVEHASGDVTVTVGSLGDGFYVADDGPGIDDAEREQVFEFGYSTTEDGDGFGLAIVKQIAEAHGWDVAATESADGGAAFEFTGVDRVEEPPQARS